MNDFDKPFIPIEFASWHLLMETVSNSLLGFISIISYLALS